MLRSRVVHVIVVVAVLVTGWFLFAGRALAIEDSKDTILFGPLGVGAGQAARISVYESQRIRRIVPLKEGTRTLTDITRCVIYAPVTRLSSANPNDLLPLPVAMFHILVAVADQDRHGYAIMQDVAARTNGALKLSPGTLYGSIRRMLEEALIIELSDRQRPDEDDERRRYYRITAFGRSVAQAEAARLSTLLRQAKAVGLAPGRT